MKILIGCSSPPPANFHCKPSVLMVDELLSAYPHQLTFSEAGMRIMITSHFSPRTRLAMASRMLINEVCGRHRQHVTQIHQVLCSAALLSFKTASRQEANVESVAWSFSSVCERQQWFHCWTVEGQRKSRHE